MKLTANRLRELLHYNPDTGAWAWRQSNGRRVHAGMQAGSINGCGKRAIQVDGATYLGARLAWLYMTGEWPERLVDHVNRVRDDDRWENLREATHSQNSINRVETNRKKHPKLPRGVYPIPSGRFTAIITVAKKTKYLGVFDTPEAAHGAYLAVSSQNRQQHQEFMPT